MPQDLCVAWFSLGNSSSSHFTRTPSVDVIQDIGTRFYHEHDFQGLGLKSEHLPRVLRLVSRGQGCLKRLDFKFKVFGFGVVEELTLQGKG